MLRRCRNLQTVHSKCTDGNDVYDVSVTDLRSRLPEYLRRVSAGEEIRITSRGPVIANLVPPRDARDQAEAVLAALRRTATVGDVVSPAGETWKTEA